MNVSAFPSDAVDFFIRSISKIKQDREKETYKVNEHEMNLLAVVTENTIKWNLEWWYQRWSQSRMTQTPESTEV